MEIKIGSMIKFGDEQEKTYKVLKIDGNYLVMLSNNFVNRYHKDMVEEWIGNGQAEIIN